LQEGDDNPGRTLFLIDPDSGDGKDDDDDDDDDDKDGDDNNNNNFFTKFK